jgi:hypothetical protein
MTGNENAVAQPELTKIEGKGTSGDFVHRSQTMAKDDGFKNVSKIWYDKTLSYDQIREHLQTHYDRRQDILGPMRAMVPGFNEAGEFTLTVKGGACDGLEKTLTEYAMNQYLLRLDLPQTVRNDLLENKTYPNGKVKIKRDEHDRALFLAFIENGLRHYYNRTSKKDEPVFRFRSYKDGGQIQAVLTQSYSCVPNFWYLEIVNKMIPGGRYSHVKRADDNTLYGNVLIPDTIREEDDSDYGGMLSLSNCEIGKRKLEQFPSVFRAICMNGCIWDQTSGVKLSKRHRGIDDLDDLKRKIVDNLNKQIPLAHDGIDKLLATRAEAFNLGDVQVQKVFVAISEQFKLGGKHLMQITNQYLKHESANRNLFGVVNAITRAGQHFDNNEWVAMDGLGGILSSYTPEKWGKLLNVAKQYDQDDLQDWYTSDTEYLKTYKESQPIGV